MLTSERKRHILTLLAQEGRIVAKELGRHLGISEDTIRRDLRELAGEGLLQRVHGGALPVSSALVDYAGRRLLSPEAKVAIGRAAAGMVQPGQVVIVDGGTTTDQLVRHLPVDLHATVVTHSPSIAVALVEHPTVEVVLIGGRLFKHSVVAVGAAAIEAIGRIRADVYFMGVCSVHPQAGISTGDLEEAYIKRALVERAGETVALVSAEKLDTAAPYTVGPLSDLATIITERDVPDAVIAPYEQAGVTVIRA